MSFTSLRKVVIPASIRGKKASFVLPCFLHICCFSYRFVVTFVTMKKESFPLEVVEA